MVKKILGVAALLTVSTVTMAQEGNFADYLQPMRSFVSFKNDFETSLSTGATVSTISNGSLELVGENHVYTINQTGGNQYFQIVGFKIPAQIGEYVDVDFDLTAESGVYEYIQMTLRGSGGVIGGTGSNGGFYAIPVDATTKTVHVHFHRQIPGGFNWDHITIDRPWWMNSVLGGGGYDDNAKVRIDNLRVTFPKQLTGVSRITGTTDKNIGAITFSNDGTTLGTYKDWIKNIGNVTFLDVFGRTNFGFDSDAKSSSNLLVSRDNGSYNSFALERFSNSFDSFSNTAWIGTSVLMTGVDRYYGVSADTSNYGQQYLLRQNITGDVYHHTVRCLSDSFYYGNEMDIDLGGEELVAVADVNGDSKDDLVTRFGTTFNLRLFTGNTGSNPNRSITLSAPIKVAHQYGYLKVIAVDDINGDGCDDLLMQDVNNGHVYAGFCSATSITLDWLFTLNSSNGTFFEKIIALADADNDGLPDIYTSRYNSGIGQYEFDIRKIDASNPSNAQISAYTGLAIYDNSYHALCSVGDINGDGSADLVMVSDDASNNQLATFLTDPATRTLLGTPHWIASARGSYLRPIFK